MPWQMRLGDAPQEGPPSFRPGAHCGEAAWPDCPTFGGPPAKLGSPKLGRKVGQPQEKLGKSWAHTAVGELGACDHGRDHAALAVGKQAKSRTARGNG